MLEKGYTQLYTGNGKGKTTASLGLALRASGAGLKSIIIQFMKGQFYSEIDAVKNTNGLITLEQYGSKKFCRPQDDETYPEHKEFTEKGLARAREVLADPGYSLVILDEIVTTTLFKLISIEEIISLIKSKPENKELVITGRGGTQELIDAVDLATEMKELKHYYTKGVEARKGIEN
ncbi:MAG: cob(I)yrinic acid a,c-diamide adenosyltransferase [bacterium]|nr:cob(I)yrinic acid a,c-diamide adenosyltransferase [bacterium]